MNAKRVTKEWLSGFLGAEIESGKYSSFWQTDGGKDTHDFDRMDEGYEIVHQTSSKTYWGKLK